MSRYHSPRELAHAVQQAAPVQLGILLYSTERPDTTPVWLLPDSYENPAHHRAKFGLWPWGSGRSGVRAVVRGERRGRDRRAALPGVGHPGRSLGLA